MLDSTTPLVAPQLGALYQALAPWAVALLRAAVGLWLIPHGLRFSFGLFPNSGAKALSIPALGAGLARSGYRPGLFWAVVVVLLELIGGPMLALGLCTRLVAVPIAAFLFLAAYDHAVKDGYFWNKEGLEYPLLWALAALLFVIIGGGPISLDHLIGREF